MTLGQGVGSGIGFIVGSYFGFGGLGMSLGGYIGYLLDPPGPPPAPDLGDLGVNNYIRGTPIPIVIGENRCYGGVIFIGNNYVEMEDQGSKKSPQWEARYYADFAIAFSEGELELDAYLTYYINDNSIDDAEDEDSISLTTYEYFGTSTQTVNSIIEDFLSGEDIGGTGFIKTAYVVCSGSIGVGNSIPTISVDMKGLLTLTDEHDANPVASVYEWITNPLWGMGFSTDLMDGSPTTSGSWKTEADFCDELVSTFVDGVESQEPRFRYSRVFDEKMKGFDIIQDILQTCRGFIYIDEGKIKINIEKNSEEPVFYFGENCIETYVVGALSTYEKIYCDLSSVPTNFWIGDIVKYTTESNIIEKIIVINQTSTYIDCIPLNSTDTPTNPTIGSSITIKKDNIKENTFSYYRKKVREKSNRIRIEFINRDDDYRWDEIEDDNDSDITITNEIREQTIRMEGIKRKTQAGRMACFLKDMHEQINYFCSFETDIVGYLIKYGSIVGVTHTIPGWSAKLFRAVSFEESTEMDIKLSLIEYVPSILHDYSKPITSTDGVKVTNPYTKPENVERFDVKESTINAILYLTFKRPDNSSYWSGCLIYYQENSGEWKYHSKQTVISPSCKLNIGIDADETTITYDPTTMYGSFTSNGVFWVEDEEIYYESIDDENNQFLNCVRGYNDTSNTSHTIDQYAILHQNTTPYFEYTDEQIESYLTFKAISINAVGMQANSETAPTDSVFIRGDSKKPKPPGLLQLNSQRGNNILTSGDAVLTWQAVTGGTHKGFGYIYGYDGYGDGILTDVLKYKVEVYQMTVPPSMGGPWPAVEDPVSAVRTVYVEKETETWTYTEAMNDADAGIVLTYWKYLRFKVYQINNKFILSDPAILTTNTDEYYEV